jgi:hypothetical protein
MLALADQSTAAPPPALKCRAAPAAALTNGTIQLWSSTGNFGRSAALGVVPVPGPQRALFGTQTWKYASGSKHTLKAAHAAGVEVVDLRLLRDGHSLLSRAADDTAKLWDIRQLKDAVHAWELPLPHSHSRLAVSPQEDLLLAGVAVPPPAGGAAGGAAAGEGLVAALSLQPPYSLVQQIGIAGAATALAWHPRLNQILVGSGDRGKGWTHVLYNPDMSEKGALLCAAKRPRQKNPLDYEPPLLVHTPGALPLFRDDNWRKRRRLPDVRAAPCAMIAVAWSARQSMQCHVAKVRPVSGCLSRPPGLLAIAIRLAHVHLSRVAHVADGSPSRAQDMRKAKIADPGPTISGPGGGGKIGHTGHTLLTRHLLERGGMQRLEDQVDPREAFLRHAGTAEKDLAAWTKAYEKTQPTRQFAEPDEDEEEGGGRGGK